LLPLQKITCIALQEITPAWKAW